MIDQYGRRKWKSMLEEGRKVHHFGFLQDGEEEKLRKKYNDLTDKKRGKLNKQFKPTKFRLNPGEKKADLMKEEFISRERTHAFEQAQNAKLHEEMIMLYERIEAQEKSLSTMEKLST